MSHNTEGAEGQDNIYGSLTNSLIYPNALQYTPMSQHSWQGPMGWQQDEQTVDNGYANFYQGHIMGAPPNYLYNEQELLPYDEGDEDFYENQDQQWDSSRGADALDTEQSTNVKSLSLLGWLVLS